MIRSKLAPLLMVCFFLVSCSGTDPQGNEKVGATAGAVIGAVIGSKIGASLDPDTGRILGASLGAVFGTILGKEVARTLNDADLKRSDEAAQETMETADTGDTVEWSNPDTGNSGTYIPTSDHQDNDGEVCRDFRSTVLIDGEEKIASGRACRQDDGTWKIVP